MLHLGTEQLVLPDANAERLVSEPQRVKDRHTDISNKNIPQKNVTYVEGVT